MRFVEPLHRESGYFLDNRSHIGSVDFDPVLYLDADTIIFGDVTTLAERFAGCDVAARPSDWAFRGGYRSSFAPDIVCPMNSGTVLMSAEFAGAWFGPNRPRASPHSWSGPNIEIYAMWLRRNTPIHVEQGGVGILGAGLGRPLVGRTLRGYRLPPLAQQPEAEDPLQWRRSTIFHTYSTYWASCLNRLLAR